MRLASGSSGTAGAASSMRCISAGLSPSALMLGPFWESLAAIMDAADESGHEQTAKSAREPHGTHLCFRQNWGDEQNAQTARPTQRAKARCDGCATQQNVHVPDLDVPCAERGETCGDQEIAERKRSKAAKEDALFPNVKRAGLETNTKDERDLDARADLSKKGTLNRSQSAARGRH